MKIKKRRISKAVLRGLFGVVVVAIMATTAFLWLVQTRITKKNAENLLELNITDVRQDIMDATDEHLLNLAWEIAGELNNAKDITTEILLELAGKYDVTEINYVNESGIIEVSTYPDF